MSYTLKARIGMAVKRITDGLGAMRIPADPSDPDIVLTECLTEIERLEKLAYLGDHHFPDLTYKARLDELVESYRETVKGQCAPDELHCSCVPALREEIRRLEAEALEHRGCPSAARPLKAYEHAHGKHSLNFDAECVVCRGAQDRTAYAAAIAILLGVISANLPPLMATTVITLAASRSKIIAGILETLRKL